VPKTLFPVLLVFLSNLISLSAPENGRKLYLWVGVNSPSKLLQDLFGAPYIEGVDSTMTSLPSVSSVLSKQARDLIDEIRTKYQLRFLPLEIVRQREPVEGSPVSLPRLVRP